MRQSLLVGCCLFGFGPGLLVHRQRQGLVFGLLLGDQVVELLAGVQLDIRLYAARA